MSIKASIFWFLLLLLLSRQSSYGQNLSTGRQIVKIVEGSSAVLHASSAGANSFIWFKDGVVVNGQITSSLITATPGIYKVASINNQGCTSDISDEIEVMVVPKPSADVSITKHSEKKTVISNQVFEYVLQVRNNGEDTVTGLSVKDILPEELIFESLVIPLKGDAIFDASSRTVTWNVANLANGEFIDLIIKVHAKQQGLIINSATVTANELDPNLSNNKAVDSKEIVGLKIPNVFTPNGDGKNDAFYLEHLDAFEHNEITIMNRWGSTVYQAAEYANNWTALGLSDGTYFYVIRVKNGNDDWKNHTGYITVIR